ncbi:MAG: hypothetical protein OEM67_05680 [Thermoleophilia bacterium]|nr:hypothetical protein [Thermoleophilia bacterium]
MTPLRRISTPLHPSTGLVNARPETRAISKQLEALRGQLPFDPFECMDWEPAWQDQRIDVRLTWSSRLPGTEAASGEVAGVASATRKAVDFRHAPA